MSKIRKFNSLLNDVTILNFPLIWKLTKRYYFITLMVPFLSSGMAIYLYSAQNVLYETSVGFSDASTKNLSPTNTIANLIGENQVMIAEEDVVAMKNDWIFLQKLAKRLFKLPGFYSFNFNSVRSSEKTSTNYLIESCKHEEECIIKKLRNKLNGLFTIETEATPGRYRLISVTLDAKTSKAILREVAHLIEEERSTSLKSVVQKKIQATERLIKQKQNDLYVENKVDLSNKEISLKNQIEEVKNEIRNLSQNISNNKLKFSTLKLHLTQFKKAKAHSVGVGDNKRIKYEKYTKLNKDILDLRKNIGLLSQSNSLTEYENRVIKDLQNDLNKKLKELDNLGKVNRSVSGIDKFMEVEDSKTNYVERDYNILKEKIKNDQLIYEEAKVKLDKLQIEKASVVSKLEELKPDVGYLELLGKKLISLRLLASTITTDLVVDNISNHVKVHKNASSSKYLMFSTVMSIFFIFLLVVLRYLFDQKIYGEEDVKVFFDDLEVIGNTPEFEK